MMPASDTPRIFRIALQVADLEGAVAFYTKILGTKGRRIHGARHYFDCGAVILAVIEVEGARPTADYLYFSVTGIAKYHARARRLGCLATEEVHGEPGGEVVERPWGERSFYASDPSGNLLCFVEARTVFKGRQP